MKKFQGSLSTVQFAQFVAASLALLKKQVNRLCESEHTMIPESVWLLSARCS
jgi:hypothetical protein